MTIEEPITDLDARFSSDGASPTPWAEGLRQIEQAQVFWLSTVRPDGRPHVTPLISVWLDGAAYFCTGSDERKAHNLAQNPHCILTTGRNALDVGLDLVIEGVAAPMHDDAVLRRLADAYVAKYGSRWRFDVRDGDFHGDGGQAAVFGVVPTTIFGFQKGTYSQTRWRFSA